jgi:3-oxoacyl-[acyl-carrier-protein] synthase II
MGLITSLGTGPEDFIDSILAGKTGLAPISSYDTSSCRSHMAGKLSDFDPAKYIKPAKLRRIDEVGRIAVSASRLAIEDGAFELDEQGSDDIGVILGSFTAGLHSTVEYCEGLMLKGPNDVIPLIFSNTVGNAPASLCALEFRLRGPNITVSHKEASGLSAIAFSTGLLRDGRASTLLAGGVDELEQTFFRIHDKFGVLSPRDDAEEAARPFDRRRNGFVFGEGGFVMALETWTSASKRGARIYAEILGVGASSSPCRINEWPTDPSDLSRAMSMALSDGECEPGDVDLLVASANGTGELDRTEATAIQDVFDEKKVPVASVKGAIGEFSAGGAAGLATAVLSLRKGKIPPTAGFEQPDSDCPVEVSPTARQAGGPIALINSFASGGTNYSVLVRALT